MFDSGFSPVLFWIFLYKDKSVAIEDLGVTFQEKMKYDSV